jgi:hypothetical protein
MTQPRLVGLFLLLVLAASVPGQQSLNVSASLERAIKDHAPEWTLASLNVRKTKEENNTSFRWKHEDQEVAVFVNECDSVEQARVTLNSNPTQAPRKREEIKGIGDEAIMAGSAPYGNQRVDVIFRKGKVRIDVEAPSAELAQRFAAYLAAALPDN